VPQTAKCAEHKKNERLGLTSRLHRLGERRPSPFSNLELSLNETFRNLEFGKFESDFLLIIPHACNDICIVE